MFENVGGKLKGLAAFVAVGGIISSMISGIILAVTLSGAGGIQRFAAFIITAVIGSLASWFSSWSIYAIGDIHEMLSATTTATQSSYYKNAVQNVTCPKCGNIYTSDYSSCPKCGYRATKDIPSASTTAAPSVEKWECPKCGCRNVTSIKYCTSCGTSKYSKA
jgi:hypothetical protein